MRADRIRPNNGTRIPASLLFQRYNGSPYSIRVRHWSRGYSEVLSMTRDVGIEGELISFFTGNGVVKRWGYQDVFVKGLK